MNSERLQVEALEDQAWAGARSRIADIERIARIGTVESDEDVELAVMCCCLVAAKLRMPEGE